MAPEKEVLDPCVQEEREEEFEGLGGCLARSHRSIAARAALAPSVEYIENASSSKVEAPRQRRREGTTAEQRRRTLSKSEGCPPPTRCPTPHDGPAGSEVFCSDDGDLGGVRKSLSRGVKRHLSSHSDPTF